MILKQVNDFISLVANAVATHTEEECIAYLSDKHFNSIEEAQVISHCIDVLNQINNKTKQKQYEINSRIPSFEERLAVSSRQFPRRLVCGEMY